MDKNKNDKIMKIVIERQKFSMKKVKEKNVYK